MKKKAMKKVVKKPVRKAGNRLGLTPAGDRVLIRRAASEEVTSFGIIIPDTTREKSEEGTIVAVGPGKRNNDGKLIPMSFSVGQKVRFAYGEEIKVNGIDHVLVHEDNIVAILN